MAKEKRTKPCANCKKSKVRCIYTDRLPCERCVKTGQGANCQFVPKLPSLKLPEISPVPSVPRDTIRLPPFNPLMKEPTAFSPRPPQEPAPEDAWKNQMENKINVFDDKLNDLVDILKSNQQMLMDQLRYYVPNAPTPPYSHLTHSLPPSRPYSPAPREPPPKKRRISPPADFRDGFLDMDQARALFAYFDANISQQLFGFEISKFQVDAIWDSSPILVCAICTIASMHHPDFSGKAHQLQTYLRDLCGKLLYNGKPRTESDGYNTIVALVLCSFWLSDLQMFTGLALQLAKEIGLDNPELKSSLLRRNRLKLWYLLYILDGQQSLTFNRQPLVNSAEYTLKHSKELLLNNKLVEGPGEGKDEEPGDSEADPRAERRPEGQPLAQLTDLRLVSQVEYNQALNEAFSGHAWELLTPLAWGIPSKSNLELDRWMVSWAVLLSPVNNGAVWLSKSTLIYYNFAKMHINSSSVRQIQLDAADEAFPKLQKPPAPVAAAPVAEPSSDSDSDDEFVSNELAPQDEAVAGATTALNAAQTVLNLVLSDKDILTNLKYVPVHIHIMLYYAALLLMNPPSNEQTPEAMAANIDRVATVRTLQRKIYLNLPTDRNFAERLLRSLESLLQDKAQLLKKDINSIGCPAQDKLNLINQLDDLTTDDNRIVEVDDGSRDSSPVPERISAWPGSHHGHP